MENERVDPGEEQMEGDSGNDESKSDPKNRRCETAHTETFACKQKRGGDTDQGKRDTTEPVAIDGQA